MCKMGEEIKKTNNLFTQTPQLETISLIAYVKDDELSKRYSMKCRTDTEFLKYDEQQEK